jgi:hypothetical protein
MLRDSSNEKGNKIYLHPKEHKEISGNVFVAVLAVKQKSQADLCQAHYINNEGMIMIILNAHQYKFFQKENVR